MSTHDEKDAATPSKEAEQSQAQPQAFSDMARGMRAWLKETFPGHEHAVIGGVIGLVAAILLFTIGIFKTLVIAVFVVLGVALGQYLDGDPRLIRTFMHLFEPRGQ